MDQVCAIWGTVADTGPVTNRLRPTYYHDSARAGGSYFIALGLKRQLNAIDAKAKARLTTWLVNQHRAGVAFPEVTEAEIDAAKAARPMSYSDKMERFFLVLDRHAFGVGDDVDLCREIGPNHTLEDDLRAWCESSSDAEFDAFLRLMITEGFIELDIADIYQLTVAGFSRLEDVSRRHPNTLNAFVAMWFDASMTEVFDDGIAPALRDAGYMPIRIDRQHHSGKIDDQIVAEIRRARFVVADFTCGTIQGGDKSHAIPRGGVYYEAGYAMGREIPVIWSVRADQIGDVHFDTRQFPHITWTTPAELNEALYQRVAALIGLAPGVLGR